MSEPIITSGEQAMRNDLRELVRQAVEDTLNGLLEEEADDPVGAGRCERTAEREAYRAGHYGRRLATTPGEVTVRMPKLKGMRFTTAIIERRRRREAGGGEAMAEMRLGGCRPGELRTSAKPCGARACRPRPSPTSTRRRSRL